jgi:hypothetical protein
MWPFAPCPNCGHDPGPQAETVRLLLELNRKADKIIMTQSDIDAATSAIEGEVADLQAKDAQILAAQQQLLATIAAGGTSDNTQALVQATADLLTAQGADDATVAALVAAAGLPPAVPAPAPGS